MNDLHAVGTLACQPKLTEATRPAFAEGYGGQPSRES